MAMIRSRFLPIMMIVMMLGVSASLWSLHHEPDCYDPLAKTMPTLLSILAQDQLLLSESYEKPLTIMRQLIDVPGIAGAALVSGSGDIIKLTGRSPFSKMAWNQMPKSTRGGVLSRGIWRVWISPPLYADHPVFLLLLEQVRVDESSHLWVKEGVVIGAFIALFLIALWNYRLEKQTHHEMMNRLNDVLASSSGHYVWEAIGDVVQGPFVVVGHDGGVTYLNHAASTLLGLQVGHHLLDVSRSGDQIESFLSLTDECLASNQKKVYARRGWHVGPIEMPEGRGCVAAYGE